MRTAWQCESTWSLGVHRWASKPLDLAPGQESQFCNTILWQHIHARTGTVAIYRRRTYADSATVENCVLLETSDQVGQKKSEVLTLTYSNPCNWHTCACISARHWELMQTKATGLPPVTWLWVKKQSWRRPGVSKFILLSQTPLLCSSLSSMMGHQDKSS